MYCKRFLRVLPVFAFTASLSYAAFLTAPEAHLIFAGHSIALADVDGGWPSHEIVDPEKGPSAMHHKHIGGVKYEDIKVSVKMGQFDPIVLDTLNTALKGGYQLTSKFSIEIDGVRGAAPIDFFECWPHEIVSPGFDAVNEECTGWDISFGTSGGTGYPGLYLMKAKEKANRTKCANNLRLVVNDGGKPRTFEVSKTEPVHGGCVPCDLDGDGYNDMMDVQVGPVVVYVPASQSGFFDQWMKMSGENPLYEGNKKDATLRILTGKLGEYDFSYSEMQPVAVTRMADGSVRVEFTTAKEQLEQKPRN